MKLNGTNNGVVKNMVWLHGLFGNKRNWGFIANDEHIRSKRRSILFDLRNHGESDHHDSHTYKEMVEDVIRNLDAMKIDKFTLLGHSMGIELFLYFY
jgi:pimeloyl-ACP methyl ester carboxylesterase